MPTAVTIKKIGIDEAEALLNISRELFFVAFAHSNNPDDMAAYADKAFTLDRLTAELNTEDSQFYFAYLESDIVGYLKLNFNAAQTEFQDPDALEIERIYIDPSFQNKRIGQQLLQFALDIAANQNMQYVWLGVWDANHHAIRFYERNGFQIFSSHEFMLGNDRQTDLLMRKDLTPS